MATSSEIKAEYTKRLQRVRLQVAKLAKQLDGIDGVVGYEPLPDGIDYGHIGDLGHIAELLSQIEPAVVEHVVSIAQLRVRQAA